MLVYHGSVEVVENPEIRESDRTLDYGSGFYTTTSYEQAVAWVKRKMAELNKQEGYVCVYELNELQLQQLNLLYFDSPSEEWVDFVMCNRTIKGFVHDFDVVYGPVANDRVYASFALYEAGLISKTTLINELKAYRLVDQFLFHTDNGIKTIKFLNAEEIKR
ncbi:MAG: DUF3990 domain-containing protein [Bacteroidales bacterium]|nr:DUF3990 domain-containing protein [Bacteroidales bacterium]